MIILSERNVNDALISGMHLLAREGYSRDSRNGPVLVSPCPVTTIYEHPYERVLFHPWRDANPFFHFYESLWMLAGSRNVTPLTRYVKRMSEFSDNGQIFNAAYGWRWRREYGKDQLKYIIEALKSNKDCRRQVLQIWSAETDLGRKTKDAACNLTVTFQISVKDQLDMTVFCRSNDVIWGCYGANAVHFSMLQEFVAQAVNVAIGKYYHISVNWHAYEKVFYPYWEKLTDHKGILPEQYPLTYPLMSTGDYESWLADVHNFVTDDGSAPKHNIPFKDPFFNDVAVPIVTAHDFYKNEIGEQKYIKALRALEYCQADDWRKACTEWIQRRYAKWHRAADDGVRFG